MNIDDDDGGRRDPVKFYGPWAWVFGLLAGGFVTWLMFALSDGFH